MPSDARDFVLANTVPAASPLVPEIKLHLATEVTPLWQATEAALERHQLPPPYWAFAWAGGQALARHLLDHPELVAGRRVLDFGAGCGIVAIAAAKAGARVAAAEIDSFAVAALSLNSAANGVDLAIETGDVLAQDGGGWDVILAGDMCYERPLAERLLVWLEVRARGVRWCCSAIPAAPICRKAASRRSPATSCRRRSISRTVSRARPRCGALRRRGKAGMPPVPTHMMG